MGNVGLNDVHRSAPLRLSAFAVDWLILALWGGLVFAIVMLVNAGVPPRPESALNAQVIGLVTMTLPFTLYFTLCESSRWRASIGKRVVGLGVLRRSGEQLSFGRALLRNAIKFIPWECGHTLAHQATFAGDGGSPGWVWGPAVIAAIGPLWWVVALIVTGDTPYDRWADARITRSRKVKG